MKFATCSLALSATVLIAACGGGSDDNPAQTLSGTGAQPATQPAANAAASAGSAVTIDQAAQANGFNALLAAVKKAELAPALADPNAALTVLAPTDAAFDELAKKLGLADAAALVDALPPATLKSILTYHVLSGTKRAADLGASPQSAQATLYDFDGQPASLALQSGSSGITIKDAALTSAKVTTADVTASNGVIHVIDKVLVPPGVLNIVQMAQLNPQLSSLVSAVTSADLQGTLSGTGPFTVFAPTNDAFAQAPSGLSTQQLTTVLTYHVLGSPVLAAQIPFGSPITTLAGQTFVINAGDPPTISDTTGAAARIVATDVRASNGVIHVIDKVLIPAL